MSADYKVQAIYDEQIREITSSAKKWQDVLRCWCLKNLDSTRPRKSKQTYVCASCYVYQVTPCELQERE